MRDVSDLSVGAKGSPGNANVDVFGDGARPELVSAGVDLARPDGREGGRERCYTYYIYIVSVGLYMVREVVGI